MGSAPVSGGSCTTSIYPVCPDYPMQVTLLSGVSGGYHIQTRCTGPEDHAGYPAIWCVRRIPYTDYPAGALVRRILGHPEIYPSISVVSGGSQVTLRCILHGICTCVRRILHRIILCMCIYSVRRIDPPVYVYTPVSGGSCLLGILLCVLHSYIHLCPEDPGYSTCVRRILYLGSSCVCVPVSGGSCLDPSVCPEDPACDLPWNRIIILYTCTVCWILLGIPRRILYI